MTDAKIYIEVMPKKVNWMEAKNNYASKDKRRIAHNVQTTRPTSDRVVQMVIMSQLVMDGKLWKRMSRCRTMYRNEAIATCRLLSAGFGDLVRIQRRYIDKDEIV